MHDTSHTSMDWIRPCLPRQNLGRWVRTLTSTLSPSSLQSRATDSAVAVMWASVAAVKAEAEAPAVHVALLPEEPLSSFEEPPSSP